MPLKTADCTYQADRVDNGRYEDLLDLCHATASRILDASERRHLCPTARPYSFIVSAASDLVTAYGDLSPRHLERTPVPDLALGPERVLALIEENLDRLSMGEVTGEQLMAREPWTWTAFMNDWPLAEYGVMTADFLIRSRTLPAGFAIELGAGVGNTSRHVHARVGGRYLRTDLVVPLLQIPGVSGELARHDFNRASRWRDADVVFAVNALHCARDLGTSLAHIFQMLRPGGWLVLGEGSPHTRPGLPWALTFACGLFSGWWDVGGFQSRQRWLSELNTAGFGSIVVQRLVSGSHDLGGVIAARKD